ncbi:Tyrosine kinase receptor Cad96Ca [Eumeta japonica]|uniref:receptor protein-tyrosine kinase n=1 Tax=Eumeta variegata TaxID=151549 RepID=A0A4C1XG70_EUMVA|nr:Tyrosine kinase receptor Cad96Ca [Eumeta japonica]
MQWAADLKAFVSLRRLLYSKIKWVPYPKGKKRDPVTKTPLSVRPSAIRLDLMNRDSQIVEIFIGVNRRPVVQSTGNGTRDSQLLSVLAARRRQLLHGRLATHVNTIAQLAAKPKGNTTFAQLEIRHTNSSIVKKVTLSGNSTDKPTLKVVTTDGARETTQHDVKPHELKHIFVPKIYQDIRSRPIYISNRRKEILNVTRTEPVTVSQNNQNEGLGILYVPSEDEKLEGLDKEALLDPEEEFQVDESNHGFYLLNYSDTINITEIPYENTTVNSDKNKETNVTPANTIFENNTENVNKNLDLGEKIISANSSTEIKTLKQVKPEGDRDKGNQTLFMPDEIYNHFRPLEELPAEDMAPFISFGQKLGGAAISDNLTNSPSLSASTKSVNFIIAPVEKRKFNSRYSATEKYKNTSANEEEINEDMDVSVVKNIIEKNKIRNSVKGPAPARPVGLVNAYKKPSTSTTYKPPNISQLNVTENAIVNSTPLTTDKSKDNQLPRLNGTYVKQNGTNSRNYTRGYNNFRRRPARVTALSTENGLISPQINATTEKASTLVYTAVVTSVSITSSMKGQNKTDNKEGENDTVVNNEELRKENVTLSRISKLNDSDFLGSSTSSPSTLRPYRHKIRIRITTPETFNSSEPVLSSTPYVFVHRPTDTPDVTMLSTVENFFSSRNYSSSKNAATGSRLPERLVNLYAQSSDVVDKNVTGTTIRPQNILKRRRRPTTTTSTTTMLPSSGPSNISTTIRPTTNFTVLFTEAISPLSNSEENTDPTIETTFKPFVVTSRTSSESSTKTLMFSSNTTSNDNEIHVNSTKIQEKEFDEDGKDESSDTRNEEVVIEVDKSYTASYVLAGLGFLPVAAIIIFVLRSILNKKTKEIDTDYEGYFDDSEIKKDSPITPVARPPMSPPTKPDQKWEFPRNKLRLQTLLGQGNFGQVWKAEADDLNGHDGLTRLVAVKTIKETASQKEKQELLHEIYIMQKIGTHPNVVTLLACCTEQEPYLLVMEYVMCGKLLTYLRERRSRPDRFSGSGALTSRDLTVFAYCVARGMDYIASKGIVHRDLAARNVLVDHNKLCKIADFGMSRELSGDERSRPPQRHALPIRWMAPEALLYNMYNHETDVWAYGILLWEIVTLGSTPYAAMSGREVLSAVTEGYRLERPPHCKPQLYHAMHACWNADPTQRPSFAILKAQLAELLDNEPSEGHYVDLDSFYQESSVYSDPSAIIHDDEGLSSEYDRERRCFRELAPAKFDKRDFNYRDDEMRNKFGLSTQRMCGFGIRDVPFNERSFNNKSDFNNKNDFNDRNFNKNDFNDRNFISKNDFSDLNFNNDKGYDNRNFQSDEFTDDRPFNEKEFNFNAQNFKDRNFNLDSSFTERKDGKLSTSSFNREREKERENPLVSRNSFSGFPRVAARDAHFQKGDSRNKRVSEFECNI